MQTPDIRELAMWRTTAAMSCVSREGMSATRLVHLAMSVTLVAMFLPVVWAASDKKKTESCEYDLDMASKKVKIVCTGSPSMVNVYATSAVMESSSSSNNNNINNNFGENSYDKHVLNIKKDVPSFMHGQAGNTEDLPRRDTDFGQQLQPPERMTFPESDNLSLEEELEEAEDIGYGLPGYSGAFDVAVLNVSERLREARDNLSSCGAAIRNISTWLDQGDTVLRPVTDNLRRINISVTDLKEGIIAASRNRHNFMGNILLTRTYEQRKIVEASSLLMDMTMDGLSSAVTAHTLAMDEVSTLHDLLRRLRKRLSKEITRHDHLQGHEVSSKSAGKCPKQISAIGRGSAKDMQWTSGAYMVQSGNAKEHKSIFIMADTGPSSELREYYSSSEIDYNLVGKYFLLPFSCSGTGHVVYRRHFYCHKTDTNLIVKYNLKRSEIVSELALPGARYGNTQAYTSGENTDIDLAVDELGLWAIYATDVMEGNMVIAKIDHKKMEIERTWPTTYPKRQAGNAFMICGSLYATNSHSDAPTFIRYIYHTDNNKEQRLQEGVLPLTNSASPGLGASAGVGHRPTNSVMLSYDFRSSFLYSWNNGRVESFPVYFRESA